MSPKIRKDSSAYHWTVIPICINASWHNTTGIFSICGLYRRNKEARRLSIIAQPMVVTLNMSDTCGSINQQYISTHRQAELQNRITINNNKLSVRFKTLFLSFFKKPIHIWDKKVNFLTALLAVFWIWLHLNSTYRVDKEEGWANLLKCRMVKKDL
jgi:hypothetical protein